MYCRDDDDTGEVGTVLPPRILSMQEDDKKLEEFKVKARRHASLFVPKGKEVTKWMQEYSGFNLQEIQENLIESV